MAQCLCVLKLAISILAHNIAITISLPIVGSLFFPRNELLMNLKEGESFVVVILELIDGLWIPKKPKMVVKRITQVKDPIV